MSDKAKIKEIIERYNEFLREFENLSKVLDQLPLYKAASVLNKLINAIKALRELMNDMSPKVWEVLWDFANCKSELVQKLNKEELIQLVKTLKALAQTQLITIENKIAELEDKGQNVPAELRTQKDKLEQIINGLSERFINDLQQTHAAIAHLSRIINHQHGRIITIQSPHYCFQHFLRTMHSIFP